MRSACQGERPGCSHWDGDRLILEIRLQPRAGGNAIAGVENGRLRVRVSAPPVDNQANRRMLEMLAREFGVPKSAVRLISGAGARDKRVAVRAPRRRPRGAFDEPTWLLICAGRAIP